MEGTELKSPEVSNLMHGNYKEESKTSTEVEITKAKLE